jgi:Mn2+/Fe2+ NRAMP family transporter
VPWGEVAWHTLVPDASFGKDAITTVVAVLGTTISPYLFFWQTAQEVELAPSPWGTTSAAPVRLTPHQIGDRRFDIGVGTFFSNLVMFFIILTTALTLHRHGITQIETSRQAAEALAPLAGRLASLLYTLGIVGVGLLAVPTLAGSAAYALAETFGWRLGLNQKLRNAPSFYAVVILSTGAGAALDFMDVSPIKALYWSSIVNGLLAPFLLVAILLVASDRRLMRDQPSSALSRALVGVTTAVMFAAAVGMFVG